MDEEERKVIEEEWRDPKFQAGISFAISQMRDMLGKLENEMLRKY
jgi:hypothetical protein